MCADLDEAILERVRQAIPKNVIDIANVLDRAGHRTWVVGGSLRDQLRKVMGQADISPGADWDLATDARPETVQRLFRRVIPTGIKHGTVTVLIGKQGYEVTTLRGEVGYSDGRRPDSVYYVDDIREDLARRDFTVNAIAYDPLRQELVDPFDGIGDLRRRIIRAVGLASDRFGEDGLRVLRAARFVATLEFSLDPETAAAIRPSLESFAKVSPERVREEWVKAMKSNKPSRAFQVMREHGLLEVTAPVLASGETQLDMALRTVDLCPISVCLRFAALLHNLGAPTEAPVGASPAFPATHDLRAAELAHGLLASLRFSNKDRDHIVALVRHHSPVDPHASTDAELRRWLRRVGPELLPDLEHLMLAIARARNDAELEADIESLFARAHALLAAAPPLKIGDLKVSGADLQRELHLAPGRVIGELLKALLDLVVESPEQNEPDRLLKAAREWLRDNEPGSSR